MEYRNVYRRDGTPTGETVEKHAPRRAGDFFLHALLVMKTMDSPPPGQGEGRYIVQQRSLRARYFAGKWDVTGGGVQAGETPAQAACREAMEELKLSVPEKKLHLAHTYTVEWGDGSGLHLFLYACRVPVPQNGFQWDEGEVNAVGVFPYHQFRAWVMDHNDEAFGRALDEIERTL